MKEEIFIIVIIKYKDDFIIDNYRAYIVLLVGENRGFIKGRSFVPSL